MPTASSLKSAFSRAQLSLLPVLPENALNIHIPFEYSTILVDNNAERVNFLMFNYSYPSAIGGPNDSTILAFGTDTLFRQLCNAKTVYMDGTFRICPPQFYQVFTIHIFPHESRRLIPCMYCLLTGKTEMIYSKLFASIKEKANEMNLEIKWEMSMSDFESGLLPALANSFPPPFVRKGCFFHYTNSVFKYFTQHHMVRSSYEYHIANKYHVKRLLIEKSFFYTYRLHTMMRQLDCVK